MKKNVVKTSVEFFKFYGGVNIEKNPCVNCEEKCGHQNYPNNDDRICQVCIKIVGKKIDMKMNLEKM
jgi:hypothetical protein